MANSNQITIDRLPEVISRELENYSKEILKGIDGASERAAKKLVKLTKATAPVGTRGQFKKSITSKKIESGPLSTARVWYVKSPDHRLTHLLANGHATRNGGRVQGDPFLRQSWDTVRAEYEREVEQVIQNGT